MLGFWLAVPKSHLLEEDVAGIEHSAGVSCTRTLLIEEIVQNLRLYFPAVRVCLCNFAQERGLGDLGLAKVRGIFFRISSQES